MKTKKMLIGAVISALISGYAYSSSLEEDAIFCQKQGGAVDKMVATYGSGPEAETGLSKKFFSIVSSSGGNTAYISLEALSTKSNLVTTIASKLTLYKSLDTDVILNSMCSDLHGATIGMYSSQGGFVDDKGYSNICVFGDGSAISVWTLYYMARGLNDDLKNMLSSRSKPLNVSVPNIRVVEHRDN